MCGGWLDLGVGLMKWLDEADLSLVRGWASAVVMVMYKTLAEDEGNRYTMNIVF